MLIFAIKSLKIDTTNKRLESKSNMIDDFLILILVLIFFGF